MFVAFYNLIVIEGEFKAEWIIRQKKLAIADWKGNQNISKM